MSNTPSPELLEVYHLIKAGQRQTAGPLLKTYLNAHPQDVDGWWLMAHVVTKPENVEKCLERVLKLDPKHTKAREKMAKLLAIPEDEPDDQFFSFNAPARAAVPALTVAAPVQTASAPAYTSPFTTEALPDATPHDKVTFSPTLDTSALMASLPPFDPTAPIEGAPANPFNGTAANDTPRAALPKPKGRKSAPPIVDETVPVPKKSAGVETIIGVAVISIAVIVLVGMGIFIANEKGLIHWWGMPAMATLDGSAAFTFEYPEEWNGICKKEQSGYPVCGVANDPRYNHVDLYTGEEVDIVGMFSDTFSFGNFFGFEQPPDLVITTIAMDVPTTSGSYDESSMAKMMYDLTQEWDLYGDTDDLEIKYDRREMMIDGQKAYYYRFSMEDKSGGLEAFVMGDQGNMALYDVYIPHGDLMFWMTIQVYSAKNSEKIPDDVIQHMIDTINIS